LRVLIVYQVMSKGNEKRQGKKRRKQTLLLESEQECPYRRGVLMKQWYWYSACCSYMQLKDLVFRSFWYFYVSFTWYLVAKSKLGFCTNWGNNMQGGSFSLSIALAIGLYWMSRLPRRQSECIRASFWTKPVARHIVNIEHHFGLNQSRDTSLITLPLHIPIVHSQPFHGRTAKKKFSVSDSNRGCQNQNLKW
jgi:hypothetical protein